MTEYELNVPSISDLALTMNSAHLHLVLTHVPILGSLFGFLLLTIALVQKNQGLQRTSLGIFVGAALSALPTYFTGDAATAVLLKKVSTTSMDLGDQHAEVAVLALVAVLVLGTVALAGLIIYRQGKTFSRWFTAMTVALAITSTLLMTWTANLGGQIRHTEIEVQPDWGGPH